MPVTAAHAAPAASRAAAVSAAASRHGLIVKVNSLNDKAISADRGRSYKKAAKYNHSVQGKSVNAKGACRRARHAEQIRGPLDGAANGTEAAEHHNKKGRISSTTGGPGRRPSTTSTT